MEQPLWKAVWRFLRKLNIELPFDPAIPLLGIYSEKTRTHKDTCTPMSIAALFSIVKTWKQPKWSGLRRGVTYTQWNITQPLKGMKSDIFSNMDGPRNYPKWEVSQTMRHQHVESEKRTE